jgi:hypothetical protein
MPDLTFRFRAAAPDISADDSFANDLIGRKKLSEFMSQLVGNTDDSFVLALDSPWGTGKTTFLRMWLEQAKKTGSPVVYFNAWENDFAADPLACLLGEVGGLLNQISGKAKVQPQVAKVKKLGARLLKRAIPIGARLLTAGFVDEKILKDVHDAVSDLTEKAAEEAIAEHEQSKQLTTEFREALEKAVAKIAEDTSDKKRPLVFVIDELDRCRPTFAVELLERAKHFFSVPGVIFILGVDKRALSTSLQTIYGVGFDAPAYLRRFIDFEVQLPPGQSATFVASLIQRFGLEDYSQHIGNEMRRSGYLVLYLAMFFEAAKLPLRTQEQTIARLGVISRLPGFYNLLPLGLIPLLVLMASNAGLYEQLLSGALDGPELLKRWTLNFPELAEFLRSDDQGKRFCTFLNAAAVLSRGENIKEAAARLYPGDEEGENPLSHSERKDFLWMAAELFNKRGLHAITNALSLAAQFS